MAKKNKSPSEKTAYLARADSERRNSWFDDVKGRFELYKSVAKAAKAGDARQSSVSINRVPMFLKNLNKDAYVPRVVSLGLFHRKVSQPLSPIEKYKVEAVNRTVQRLPERQQHARFLVEKVQTLLPQIKESYEEKIHCEDEILAWAFTLDGCFVLEILRLLNGKTNWNLDPVFNKNRVQSCQHDILSDILKLENQIPIIVLIELLEMEENLDQETARTELLQMICDGIIAIVHPFSYKLQPKAGETEEERQEREHELQKVLKRYEKLEEYNHLLGFFHDFIVRETNREGENTDTKITMPETYHHHHHLHLRRHHHPRQQGHKRPSHYQTLMASATDLYKKGMRFNAYEGVPSSKSSSDDKILPPKSSSGKSSSAKYIHFEKEKKILHLPTIWITDTTEIMMRNLMAVDISQEKELSVISEYVFLMNSLLDTEEDAALLRKKGIIQSTMGNDKEVSDLFNNLVKGVNFHFTDTDDFEQFKISVNEWYKSLTVVKITEFMEKHPRLVQAFAMFWGVVLVVGAAAPSVGTIIKQVYQGPQNNNG